MLPGVRDATQIPTVTAQNRSQEQVSKAGYWVEPFLNIVYGKENLNEDQFRACLDILFSHREKGNPWSKNILETLEGWKREIKEIYYLYDDLRGETDLVKRAVLLETLFMQTLAQNDPCPLTEEAKRYVINNAAPNALSACNASDLVQIDQYRAWVINYLLGCLTPAIIEPQINLTEGLSEEQIASLMQERKNIAMQWYKPFTAGQIFKEDVELLVKKIQGFMNESAMDIAHPNAFMQMAYEQYINLATTLPSSKNAAYWNAIITSLNTFIERVHSAKT